MRLYYHKTDGGAEYLMDTYVKWSNNGKSGKEGVINDETKYLVRIDGDIEKDAELTVREETKNEKRDDKDIDKDIDKILSDLVKEGKAEYIKVFHLKQNYEKDKTSLRRKN